MALTKCPCGSGLTPTMAYDARMIELGYVCPRCEARKLAGFRPEVLTDPDYDHEEPIDGDFFD
jgi:hypothetical protein